MWPRTLPPGTTSSQCRSRPPLQTWCLLAPLLQEKQQLPIGHFGWWEHGINEFLWHNRTYGAFWKLMRPCLTKHEDRADVVAVSATSRPAAALSTLERLPKEVLELIMCQSTLTPADIITLGFSSKPLWAAILEYVKHDVHRHLGSWAGTPLICLGNKSEELPLAISEILPALEIETGHFGRSWDNVPPSAVQDWIDYAMRHFNELPRKDIGRSWLQALKTHVAPEELSSVFRKTAKQDLREAVHISGTEVDCMWVLRNLTTRECVRLRFIDDGDEAEMESESGFWLQFPKCVFVENSMLSLDAALLIQIWWGECDNPGSRVKRGRWTGHRFEVIPVAEHEVNEGWEDVTVSIIAEAKAVGVPQPGPPVSSISRRRRRGLPMRSVVDPTAPIARPCAGSSQ